jgi:hypothetical protein
MREARQAASTFTGTSGAQHRRPVDAPRPLVELRQVQRAEPCDPRQHARGAAQLEVGAPDLGPAALERHAAGLDRHPGETGLARLLGEQRLEAGRGDEEDLERVHVPP